MRVCRKVAGAVAEVGAIGKPFDLVIGSVIDPTALAAAIGGDVCIDLRIRLFRVVFIAVDKISSSQCKCR